MNGVMQIMYMLKESLLNMYMYIYIYILPSIHTHCSSNVVDRKGKGTFYLMDYCPLRLSRPLVAPMLHGSTKNSIQTKPTARCLQCQSNGWQSPWWPQSMPMIVRGSRRGCYLFLGGYKFPGIFLMFYSTPALLDVQAEWWGWRSSLHI